MNTYELFKRSAIDLIESYLIFVCYFLQLDYFGKFSLRGKLIFAEKC